MSCFKVVKGSLRKKAPPYLPFGPRTHPGHLLSTWFSAVILCISRLRASLVNDFEYFIDSFCVSMLLCYKHRHHIHGINLDNTKKKLVRTTGRREAHMPIN